MRQITPKEEEMFLQGQIDEKEYLEMNGRELKDFYEKFCFVNRMTE